MIRGVIAGGEAAWARATTWLFGMRVVSVVCHSQVRDRTIGLSAEFLVGAREIVVHAELSRPWFSGWAPALVYQVRDEADRELILHSSFQIEEKSHGRHLDVGIRFATVPRAKTFQVQIGLAGTRKIILQRTFTRLDARRLTGKLENPTVHFRAGPDQPWIGRARFHDRIDDWQLRLEVRLSSLEYRQMLNALQIPLRLEVVTAGQSPHRLASRQTILHFAENTCQWIVRFGALGSVVGDYRGAICLRFYLGRTPFFVSDAEVLGFDEYLRAVREAVIRQTQINGIQFHAVDGRGQTRTLDVAAEDFQALAMHGRLQGPPADPWLPPLDYRLALVIHHPDSKTETARQIRDLSITEAPAALHESLPLSGNPFSSGPGDYRLSAWLEDRLLGQIQFVHKPRQQIRREKAARILASLEVLEFHWTVQRDGEPVETAVVFATDTALMIGATIQGRGFDEDAPRLRWRLHIRLHSPTSGIRREWDYWLEAGPGPNPYADLKIPLDAGEGALVPGEYRLQLCRVNTVMAEQEFRLLAAAEIGPYTKALILASLQLENPRWQLVAGTTRYSSEIVPDSTDSLQPEFTLRAGGFNRAVPRLPVDVGLELIDPQGKRFLVRQQPMTLSPDPLAFDPVVMAVRGTRIASTPRLVAAGYHRRRPGNWGLTLSRGLPGGNRRTTSGLAAEDQGPVADGAVEQQSQSARSGPAPGPGRPVRSADGHPGPQPGGPGRHPHCPGPAQIGPLPV